MSGLQYADHGYADPGSRNASLRDLLGVVFGFEVSFMPSIERRGAPWRKAALAVGVMAFTERGAAPAATIRNAQSSSHS